MSGGAEQVPAAQQLWASGLVLEGVLQKQVDLEV